MSRRFVITVKSASLIFHQGNQIGDTARFFTSKAENFGHDTHGYLYQCRIRVP